MSGSSLSRTPPTRRKPNQRRSTQRCA